MPMFGLSSKLKMLMLMMCTPINSSIVLHPYGPLMCIALPNTDSEIITNFHIHNLSCVVEDSNRELRRESGMRCVMCTEIPGYTLEEERCQTVNNHTVCAVISNQSSCVFTTNTFTKSSDPTDTYEQSRGCKINNSKHIRTCKQRKCSKSTNKQDGQIRRNVEQCKTFTRKIIFHNRMSFSDIYTLFLKGEESVECLTISHYNVIDIAAFYGQERLFNLMLGLGVNMPDPDEHTNNLLYYAVYGRKMKIIRCLVELGFDVERRYNYNSESLIHTVAMQGSEETFDYLVKFGVDVTSLTGDGSNILEVACRFHKKWVRSHVYSLNLTRLTKEAIKHGGNAIRKCLMQFN